MKTAPLKSVAGQDMCLGALFHPFDEEQVSLCVRRGLEQRLLL